MVVIIGTAACTTDVKEITEADISVLMNEYNDIQSAPIAHTDTIILNYPDSVPFGGVSRIYATDDLFVIVDNMFQPYGFSQRGDYVCQYGSQGEAPSEFVNMSACATYKNEVVICDSYKQRMLFYNLKSGDLKRYIDFPDGALGMIQQCVFVSDSTAMLARYVYDQKNSVYATANIFNKTVTEFASVPMKTDNVAMPIGWNTIAAYQDTTIYIKPFTPYIYRYPETKWIYINQSKPIYKETELASIRDFSMMTYAKAMSNGYFAGFTYIFELKDWIFLALQDVEIYLINKYSWEMLRFKYDKDDSLNFKKIAKIIGVIPQHNALIGVNNYANDEDQIYIYYLEPQTNNL